MYCHCGKRFSHGEQGPGPLGWTTKTVQYCGTCKKMSHVIQEKEPDMYGPLNGRGPQGVKIHIDGTASVNWWIDNEPGVQVEVIEYIPYPFRKVNNMDQGRNHLMKIWQKLDACIDKIRTESQMPTEFEKVQANTYADVLAQLMSPFYADATAVLAESMSRWKARQAGEERQSPGLAEHFWNPIGRYDKMPVQSSGSTRSGGAVSTKPAVKFDQQKTTFIKHCLENGLQSPETLATMFDCTADDIKAVVV